MKDSDFGGLASIVIFNASGNKFPVLSNKQVEIAPS